MPDDTTITTTTDTPAQPAPPAPVDREALVRELRPQVEQELRAEQERRYELELASYGDVRGLGEYRLQQLRQRDAQEAAARAQRAQQEAEERRFMSKVAAFQRRLDPEVQAAVAGKRYDSFEDYVQATVEAAAAHKANGRASGGTKATTTKAADKGDGEELTDEDIAKMDLARFSEVWDLKTNRPKPGYRYRPTRAIDVKQGSVTPYVVSSL